MSHRTDVVDLVAVNLTTTLKPDLVVAVKDVPGLYDVQMSDGSWRHDLTTGQVESLLRKAGAPTNQRRL